MKKHVTQTDFAIVGIVCMGLIVFSHLVLLDRIIALEAQHDLP